MTSNFTDPTHPGTLFSSAHYNAAGALLSGTFGNGISETRTYDTRLRLATIADGSNYSLTIPSSGGYAPNSDILAANDSTNGNWTYRYDPFNRLVGSNQNSAQAVYSYVYDRFGNRWQQNGPNSMQLSFSGANNQMDGYTYDAAGNLLNDGSHQYFYDAENHLIQVDGSSGYCSSGVGTIATACYFYDANGRRVRDTAIPDCNGKSGLSGGMGYTYDLSGRWVMNVATGGGGPCGYELYAGSRHLIRDAGAIIYSHSDWLGTERARTANYDSSSGAWTLCESTASLPFGDGQVTTTYPANGYGTGCYHDSTLHFTGKQRDAETGLDNFGARYNSSSFGRFMSPDPGNVGGELDESADPQSWNAYSYVFNNPVNATDPDRLDCVYAGDFNNSGVVLIERGDKCSYPSGTYVNGTVDEKSLIFDQKSNQLSFNFSNDQNQTGGAGTISLGPPRSDSVGDKDRLDALFLGIKQGQAGVNWAVRTTVGNAIGAAGGYVVGRGIQAVVAAREATAAAEAVVDLQNVSDKISRQMFIARMDEASNCRYDRRSSRSGDYVLRHKQEDRRRCD